MADISSTNDVAVYAAAADFNPPRLSLAREAQGLSQKELAARVDTTPSAISQFESGASRPSPETVARLSLALGYPPRFFSRPLGARLNLSGCHFRKLRTAPKREQRQVLARGDLLLSVVDELQQHVVFPEEQISDRRWEILSRIITHVFSIPSPT